MSKIPCLHRRGDIWHFRRRVPLKLRPHVGITEITKSLHTADYSTALQRYQTISSDVGMMFYGLHQQQPSEAYNSNSDHLNLLHNFATQDTQFKAPPHYDQDGLKTLIKTVVEEVLEHHAPKKLSITLDDLYHRYMDDPARSRSKKTVMTYQSVYNVLMELFGSDKLINDINRDDCRQFLDVVRHLPANARKKFPKKTLVEILI
ncbi:DUF6538 domain-containing protein, partial [Terasakiella pusilla]|uniref:DUF6538 domain-containing protein n=1 Tax=Terasakiella pusilla TaxID=64973 RepID=UPI003AA7F624